MSRKKQWILCRNGEYIGRYNSPEEAQDAKTAERARLEKSREQGWFTQPVDKAFRLDIVQR